MGIASEFYDVILNGTSIDATTGIVPNRAFFESVFGTAALASEDTLYNIAYAIDLKITGEENESCAFIVEVVTTGKYTGGSITNRYYLSYDKNDVGVSVTGVEIDQGTIIF